MGRFDEIEELAESIAESYFPDDRVEPQKIANLKGITHSFGSYKDAFDGLLEYKGREFHIYTNADRLDNVSHPRARFTFGHELGHFFIDDHRNSLIKGVSPHPSFVEFQSENAAEREADTFSAALLMPRRRFFSEAKRLRPSAGSVRNLSDKFGVSYSSAAIRYAKSNATSVIVMRWNSDGRQWCWSSDDIWDKTRNIGYQKFEKIPEGSLTKQHIIGSLDDYGAPRGTTLSAWFPRVGRGGNKDLILLEEIVPIGSFGVITILYPDKVGI